MKVLISTLVACIALGTSFSASASEPSHSPAPTPSKAPLDEKKPLVDLSKKPLNDMKMSGPTHDAQGKELKRIPMPSASTVNTKLPMAGASGLPMPQSYARPQLGLSPYYGNPKDAPVARAPHSGKKHVSKPKYIKIVRSGGSPIQMASISRIDGQVRHLNQRQNNLEVEINSVKKAQADYESKQNIEGAYAIDNDN